MLLPPGLLAHTKTGALAHAVQVAMAHGLSFEDAHSAAQAAQAAASPPAPSRLLPAWMGVAEKKPAAEADEARFQTLGLLEATGPLAEGQCTAA